LTLLDIRDSKLTGTIPSELGQLTSLTDIWVNANQLTGTNPKELGQLVSFEVLETLRATIIDRNNPNGNWPTAAGSCLELLRIDYYKNILTDLAAGIVNMKKR
jgi:hypothetical protein